MTLVCDMDHCGKAMAIAHQAGGGLIGKHRYIIMLARRRGLTPGDVQVAGGRWGTHAEPGAPAPDEQRKEKQSCLAEYAVHHHETAKSDAELADLQPSRPFAPASSIDPSRALQDKGETLTRGDKYQLDLQAERVKPIE